MSINSLGKFTLGSGKLGEFSPEEMLPAKVRVEIFRKPVFFDDHFCKEWTLDTGGTSSITLDGDLLIIESGDQNPATVSRDVTPFSSDT